MLQLVDGRDGLEAHELDGVLVAQVVGTLDRVIGVPFGVVLLLAAQRRADPALGSPGVRAGRVELADHGGLGGLGGVQSGHQTRSSAANHDHFKLMRFHQPFPKRSK